MVNVTGEGLEFQVPFLYVTIRAVRRGQGIKDRRTRRSSQTMGAVWGGTEVSNGAEERYIAG